MKPTYVPSSSVSTPKFRKWFGRSVVVNEDGSPMVVYHGSLRNDGGFAGREDLGFHFGTEDAANARVSDVADNEYLTEVTVEETDDGEWQAYVDGEEVGDPVDGVDAAWDIGHKEAAALDFPGTVSGYYLRMEHPVDLPDLDDWDVGDVVPALVESGAMTSDEADAFLNSDRPGFRPLLEFLESKGYDGFRYVNKVEDSGSTSYMVFRSSQIMEADGSVTSSISPSIKRLVPIKSFNLIQILKAVDPNHIHHDQYTKELKEPFLIKAYGSSLLFGTYSSKYKKNHRIWKQKVIFKDFLVIGRDKQIPIGEAVKYAMEDLDVHVTCDCPAFLFYGYKYMATQLGYLYGLPKENRSPDIRNPAMRGSICKHVDKVMRYIVSHEQDIVDRYEQLYRKVDFTKKLEEYEEASPEEAKAQEREKRDMEEEIAVKKQRAEEAQRSRTEEQEVFRDEPSDTQEPSAPRAPDRPPEPAPREERKAPLPPEAEGMAEETPEEIARREQEEWERQRGGRPKKKGAFSSFLPQLTNYVLDFSGGEDLLGHEQVWVSLQLRAGVDKAIQVFSNKKFALERVAEDRLLRGASRYRVTVNNPKIVHIDQFIAGLDGTPFVMGLEKLLNETYMDGSMDYDGIAIVSSLSVISYKIVVPFRQDQYKMIERFLQSRRPSTYVLAPILSREVPESFDGKQIVLRAIKEYGITDHHPEAFFILPDGRMLDGSERSHGGGGSRTLDHHSAEAMLRFDPRKDRNRSRYSDLMAFMRQSGCVRVDFNIGMVDSVGVPNRRQIDTIAESHSSELILTVRYLHGGIAREYGMRQPSYQKLKSFYADPLNYDKHGYGDEDYDEGLYSSKGAFSAHRATYVRESFLDAEPLPFTDHGMWFTSTIRTEQGRYTLRGGIPPLQIGLLPMLDYMGHHGAEARRLAQEIVTKSGLGRDFPKVVNFSFEIEAPDGTVYRGDQSTGPVPDTEIVAKTRSIFATAVAFLSSHAADVQFASIMSYGKKSRTALYARLFRDAGNFGGRVITEFEVAGVEFTIFGRAPVRQSDDPTYVREDGFPSSTPPSESLPPTLMPRGAIPKLVGLTMPKAKKAKTKKKVKSSDDSEATSGVDSKGRKTHRYFNGNLETEVVIGGGPYRYYLVDRDTHERLAELERVPPVEFDEWGNHAADVPPPPSGTIRIAGRTFKVGYYHTGAPISAVEIESSVKQGAFSSFQLITEATNYENYKDVIGPSFFTRLMKCDPTPDNKFGKWLMSLFTKLAIPPEMFKEHPSDVSGTGFGPMVDWQTKWRAELRKFSDLVEKLGNVRPSLEAYQKLNNKKKIPSPQNSILTFKTVEDFTDFMKSDEMQPLLQELEDADFKKQIKVIYEDEDWQVAIPLTKAAAIKLGRGTNWCTAADSENRNYFDFYTKEDYPGSHLVDIIRKPVSAESDKWQIHLESSQWRDKRNNEVPSRIGFFLALPQPLQDILVKDHKFNLSDLIKDGRSVLWALRAGRKDLIPSGVYSAFVTSIPGYLDDNEDWDDKAVSVLLDIAPDLKGRIEGRNYRYLQSLLTHIVEAIGETDDIVKLVGILGMVMDDVRMSGKILLASELVGIEYDNPDSLFEAFTSLCERHSLNRTDFIKTLISDTDGFVEKLDHKGRANMIVLYDVIYGDELDKADLAFLKEAFDGVVDFSLPALESGLNLVLSGRMPADILGFDFLTGAIHNSAVGREHVFKVLSKLGPSFTEIVGVANLAMGLANSLVSDANSIIALKTINFLMDDLLKDNAQFNSELFKRLLHETGSPDRRAVVDPVLCKLIGRGALEDIPDGSPVFNQLLGLCTVETDIQDALISVEFKFTADNLFFANQWSPISDTLASALMSKDYMVLETLGIFGIISRVDSVTGVNIVITALNRWINGLRSEGTPLTDVVEVFKRGTDYGVEWSKLFLQFGPKSPYFHGLLKTLLFMEKEDPGVLLTFIGDNDQFGTAVSNSMFSEYATNPARGLDLLEAVYSEAEMKLVKQTLFERVVKGFPSSKSIAVANVMKDRGYVVEESDDLEGLQALAFTAVSDAFKETKSVPVVKGCLKTLREALAINLTPGDLDRLVAMDPDGFYKNIWFETHYNDVTGNDLKDNDFVKKAVADREAKWKKDEEDMNEFLSANPFLEGVFAVAKRCRNHDVSYMPVMRALKEAAAEGRIITKDEFKQLVSVYPEVYELATARYFYYRTVQDLTADQVKEHEDAYLKAYNKRKREDQESQAQMDRLNEEPFTIGQSKGAFSAHKGFSDHRSILTEAH